MILVPPPDLRLRSDPRLRIGIGLVDVAGAVLAAAAGPMIS